MRKEKIDLKNHDRNEPATTSATVDNQSDVVRCEQEVFSQVIKNEKNYY